MASQVDKVVPKHLVSFTRRKIGMRKKLAGRGALEGPRGSTRAPTAAGDVDISSYVDREKVAPNVTAMNYPSRKYRTLRQESDVRSV